MINQRLRTVLEDIRKRPLMFLRDNATLLSSVHGFINGFCYAKEEIHSLSPYISETEFPNDQFTKYLMTECGYPPGEGANWFDLISNKYGSGEHGFEHFFVHLDNFLKNVGQEPLKNRRLELE